MMPAKAVCRRIADTALRGQGSERKRWCGMDHQLQSATVWRTEAVTWDACARKPHWALCRALEEE